MTRRCSHCSNNGHNSRTCPSRGGGGSVGGGSGIGGGVKLFGVRLTDGSIMKKSASMGNLSSLQHLSSATSSPVPGSPSSDQTQGYLSDDPTHASCSTNHRAERKKGVPWTEEEHRLFLLGLQKLGKGDWRGISRNFVTSRTPTQVASHAQKYFIRQSNATRRKRRSSLFDMAPDMATDPPPLPEEQLTLSTSVVGSDKEQTVLPSSQTVEGDSNPLPSLDLSLKPTLESMDITLTEAAEEAKEVVTSSPEVPQIFPSLLPAYVPFTFSLWPPTGSLVNEAKEPETSHHQILKPIPIVPKEPVNLDALVGMSQLCLRDTATRHIEPSSLSLKLTGESSRPSAFHASTPANGSDITKGENNPIQAG